jgi:transcriptional regulator of acetoin/glycerol metabolism
MFPPFSHLLQMQDLLPEDGRITVTRFDELVTTLARTKTQAEKSRKETLKAAMAVRNGNQVPCVATATRHHSP